MYLDFFASKEHLVMKSFSLVPQNDNSLLLINAGMAPLKPYFTGQEIPPRRRVATCQKCIRTGDIENVGKTARHGTFFEMLGNFSFGDYFKEEAITWSWEFLTEVIGLEKDRLYPSVYETDDEAFDIWNKKIGIPADRISRFGKEDNFWEHGAGPCGPCSEIYYDRGEKYGCGRPDCKVGCECDRYMEIWNNVFTQFENDGKGNYQELENKNIDTGMGLERLAVVVQDVDSIFATDTIKALLDRVCELAHTSYLQDEKKDISLRVITDHIRSATFMISDGITPSNEGRGYVLRRLVRRAARHGRMLGIDGEFLAELSKTVIALSKDGYPELEENSEMIFATLTQEEDSFNRTIDQGIKILSDMETALLAENKKVLVGKDAFVLYDTYGFPLDLTKEILEEKGISVDEEGFKEEMNMQRERARSARKTTNYMGADVTVYQSIAPEITTTFVGYDSLTATSKVTVLTSETELVDTLKAGETGTILVEETPFYATMGGQKADIGTITLGDSLFQVVDTIKLQGGKVGHVGQVVSGTFQVGDVVTLSVDQANRIDTGKNHSATHLLQSALRQVLGNQVKQKGSLVEADRLRFDFTQNVAMTKEQIAEVEKLVNAQISNALPVVTEEMSLEEARKTGAMALFGEKYGEVVRVVKMGDFSTELCGGTHVNNTSVIGNFKIVSESGIAAGVRRIEALTGNGVLAYYSQLEKEIEEIAKATKTDVHNIVKKIETMQEEIKALQAENQKLKDKAAKDALGDVMNQVQSVNNCKVLITAVPDVDMNGLRTLGDDLKNKIGEGMIVLASSLDDKVSLVAMATEEAIKQGAHAGNLIKEIAKLVGGGGGGRPNMAQAGGKNVAGIQDALTKASEVIKEQLQ